MARASLPMYDLSELRAATDAWWQGVARAFRREGLADVPDALERGADAEAIWLSPDLLISQTCGYPLTHALSGRVRLVATPCYGAAGCAGPDYCSLVIVGADHPATDVRDLRGARCAINAPHSQSGCNALRALVADLAEQGRFFGSVVASGSHGSSIALVASGQADVAAIDCVTHALIARYRPAALAGTRVLCRTDSAPGLPYVTHGRADEDMLRRLQNGLRAALADPHLETTCEALMLSDIAVLPLSAYDRIAEMENAAFAIGYREVG
jgi:ABC-type phosphate/phosphonate transport system substrate-binding protein